jgi:glutathione S-transferase
MKLYYSPGACSLAPHIALREADRDFDLERVDIKTHLTANGDNFFAINPKGYVPALRVDGPASPVLTENAAILQYIADLVPHSGLAPACNTIGRYHLQEMLSFISSEVHKQFGPLFARDTPAPTEARSRTKLGERFGYLETVLANRSYLLGETFTVADCLLFAMLRWCERFEIDLAQWHHLDDYFHRIAARPAVHAALEAEGLLERKRVRRSA